MKFVKLMIFVLIFTINKSSDVPSDLQEIVKEGGNFSFANFNKGLKSTFENKTKFKQGDFDEFYKSIKEKSKIVFDNLKKGLLKVENDNKSEPKDEDVEVELETNSNFESKATHEDVALNIVEIIKICIDDKFKVLLEINESIILKIDEIEEQMGISKDTTKKNAVEVKEKRLKKLLKRSKKYLLKKVKIPYLKLRKLK